MQNFKSIGDVLTKLGLIKYISVTFSPLFYSAWSGVTDLEEKVLTSLLIIFKAFTESIPDSAEVADTQGVQTLPAAILWNLFTTFTSPIPLLPPSSPTTITRGFSLLPSSSLLLPFVASNLHCPDLQAAG